MEETYGVPCYQEQVLAILKDLGMPVVQLNAFLKAVKGKHAKAGYSDEANAVFEKNKKMFEELCFAKGMNKRQISQGWKLVEGFAAYGFNRAHATAYSLLGYQLAYLKINYPLEFHASLLETTVGTNKSDQYIRETKRMGITILPADVNSSGVSWTLDTEAKAIRRGLTSIKGVGHNAAELIYANAPYSSLDELIEKCPARAVTGGKNWKTKKTLNGTLEQLRKTGALESLGIRR